MSRQKPGGVRADDVLEWMAVPRHEGMYVLGCVSTPLTFHSQQQRACNLIWALTETGRLRPGQKVAVVGGGLAGMTAAAAARLTGADVTLFERQHVLMHLQSGDLSHRYIHPNVFDWPQEGWDDPVTDLPLLNWTAGTTGHVRGQVLARWDRHRAARPVTVAEGRDVTGAVRASDGRRTLRFTEESTPIAGTYDVVVLAVGFGVELQLAGVNAPLYWNKDDLDEPVKVPPYSHKVFVGGCGDGGLIDVLRARLKEFRHERLASDLMPPAELGPVADDLLDIDTRARAMAARVKAERGPDADVADAVSEFLWAEYLKLKGAVPRDLIARLTSPGAQRDDTEVVFSDRRRGPFSLGASVLNRFAVFLLMEFGPRGRLLYKPAHIEPGVVSQADGGFFVRVKKPQEWEGHFDRVALHLGPTPALRERFKDVYDVMKARACERTDEDPTRHRLWPDGFYPAAEDRPERAPEVEDVELTPLGNKRRARAGAAPPSNLPVTLPDIVGRDEEIAAARRMLNERLLTFVGAGGTGKTRLAKQVGAAVLQETPWPFPDGVWFVEFPRELVDDSTVPRLVADALKVGIGSGGAGNVRRALADYLRHKALLLILDNCEHVVPATRDLVCFLLRECGRVHVLATSRQRLSDAREDEHERLEGVPDEQVLEIPPLPVAELRELVARARGGGSAAAAAALPQFLQNPAFALFVRKAKRVKAAFNVTAEDAPFVAEICVRLDGLPQAVLLAAGQVNLHTVEEIHRGIRHLFESNDIGPGLAEKLRAAYDWSYCRLDEASQRLLRRLSVFAGGWSPKDAVGPVCGEPGQTEDDLLLLQHDLVYKSLIVTDLRQKKTRYRLLETAREYARDRLRSSGEADAVADRHAAHFVRFAAALEPKFRGPDQAEAVIRLERELENIRAAQKWLAGRPGKTEALLELTTALRHLYYIRGLFDEGRRWLERGLDAAGGVRPQVRALALDIAGIFAYHQGKNGDYVQAAEWLKEGRRLSTDAGDPLGLAVALSGLAFIAYRQSEDNYKRAARLYRQSLNQANRIVSADPRDKEWHVAWVQADLGFVLHLQGDQEQASRLLGLSLDIRKRIKDRWGCALAMHYLGRVREAQGKPQEAADLQEQSLSLSTDVGYRRGMALAAHYFGRAKAQLGLRDKAGELFRQSLRLRVEQGDMSGIAACLQSIGGLCARQGMPGRSAKLLGAASALREQIGEQPEPGDRADLESFIRFGRAQIGEAGFVELFNGGRGYDLDRAVGEAMAPAAGENEPPRPAARENEPPQPGTSIRAPRPDNLPPLSGPRAPGADYLTRPQPPPPSPHPSRTPWN